MPAAPLHLAVVVFRIRLFGQPLVRRRGDLRQLGPVLVQLSDRIGDLEHVLLSLNVPLDALDQGDTEVGATTDVLAVGATLATVTTRL